MAETRSFAISERKRRQNERKFGALEELPGVGRRYWYDVSGRAGWRARYVKEVDANEATTRFVPEIYNERDELVEVHQKFPEDLGHQAVDHRQSETDDESHG